MTVRFVGGMSAEPTVGYTTVRGARSFAHWLAGDHEDPTPRRAAVFDLSLRLREFDAALKAAAAPAEAMPAGVAAEILHAARSRR